MGDGVGSDGFRVGVGSGVPGRPGVGVGAAAYIPSYDRTELDPTAPYITNPSENNINRILLTI